MIKALGSVLDLASTAGTAIVFLYVSYGLTFKSAGLPQISLISMKIAGPQHLLNQAGSRSLPLFPHL